jgi:hypothetical protein
MDSHFAELRAKGERQRAERDLKRADDPELDATEATDFAIYALDCAESAIVDATIARADADALETT